MKKKSNKGNAIQSTEPVIRANLLKRKNVVFFMNRMKNRWNNESISPLLMI
ncbi:MAG: hypothetical protein MJY76_05345 [Bacteroidales bacterium]|nr:hypothetical protein [Bacteroidales bacterium]